MILTNDNLKKLKNRFMSLCNRMDYLDSHFELLEIYHGFAEDEGRKSVHPKIEMDNVDRQVKTIMKFAKDNGINLWDEMN